MVARGLPPSGDEDEGSFVNELLCGCEANAAGAAGDDSDFIFESFAHGFPFSLSVCSSFEVTDRAFLV
jgi:hypothetical protein